MRFTNKRNSRGGAHNNAEMTGFTLVELLVVAGIISVISLAIYGVFNNGIKLWQRASQSIPGENLNIFFEKFTSDLRNSFNFSGVNFTGKPDELEFATLVKSARLENISVGRVRYRYNLQEGKLKRAQEDLSQVFEDEDDQAREVLRNIKSLKFQYYIYDAQRKECFWKDESLDGKLPLAVRVELEIKYGEQITTFTKTVGIPVSN